MKIIYKLTIEQENDFLRRYFSFEKLQDLEQEFGVSHSYAYWLCKRNGIKTGRRKPKVPKPPKLTPFERIIVRLHKHTDRRSVDECWPWMGYINPVTKFAVFSGNKGYPHHFAWMEENNVKEIPKGWWVVHTCNDKTCMNPAHLILKTPSKVCQERSQRRYG